MRFAQPHGGVERLVEVQRHQHPTDDAVDGVQNPFPTDGAQRDRGDPWKQDQKANEAAATERFFQSNGEDVGANILAIALEKPFRGRGFIRFLILLPWVAPIALGAIGWKWILDSIYSVISWVLVALHFYKPFNAPMWLGEPHLAIASVLLVHSWRLMPFSTVILLAGRTAIPKDIPEAAAVDGAGFWRTQLQIVIPMMRPILSVAVLFGLIFTFTDMTVVYILTAGGPFDSTQTLPSLAFALGIQGSDLAAGAAISLFLVPLLVLIAYFMLRVAHRAEVT